MKQALACSIEGVCLLLVVACGGDSGAEGSGEFPQDTSCGIALTTSGALSTSVPPSRSSTACGTQTSFDSGLDATFLLVQHELAHVDVIVSDVLEGQVGSFPVELRVVHDDGREWRSTCAAEIFEHEHVGPADLGWERYHIEGTVRCDAALPADPSGEPPLVLDELSFVVEIAWG